MLYQIIILGNRSKSYSVCTDLKSTWLRLQLIDKRIFMSARFDKNSDKVRQSFRQAVCVYVLG